MLQATSPPPPSRCLTEVAVVLSLQPPLLVKLPLTRYQPDHCDDGDDQQCGSLEMLKIAPGSLNIKHFRPLYLAAAARSKTHTRHTGAIEFNAFEGDN